MFIDAPLDIFFLVLTLAVAVLTVLLAQLLYYLVGIVRQAQQAAKEVTSLFMKAHAMLEAIEASVRRSSSQFSLVVGGLQQILSFYRKRKERQGEDPDETPDDAAATTSRKRNKR